MTLHELLEKLTNIVGVNGLGRELRWNPGGIARAKAGGVIGPWRAAQLAEEIGDDELLAVVTALHDQARTPDEARTWERLKKMRGDELAQTEPKGRPSTAELRDLVESKLGPKYSCVVPSALERVYISGSNVEPHHLARRAKLLFDQFPKIFESGVTTLPINTRRELMADYLLGREDPVLDRIEGLLGNGDAPPKSE